MIVEELMEYLAKMNPKAEVKVMSDGFAAEIDITSITERKETIFKAIGEVEEVDTVTINY